MPLLGCTTSVIIMIGLLGLIGWKVTVISSNFYCFNVDTQYGNEYSPHSKKYLQLRKEKPELKKQEIVLKLVKKMMLPILYTVLTTICAFLSLIFSGIKPIIDFGWMMTLGLLVSISVTFLFTSVIVKYFFI